MINIKKKHVSHIFNVGKVSANNGSYKQYGHGPKPLTKKFSWLVQHSHCNVRGKPSTGPEIRILRRL